MVTYSKRCGVCKHVKYTEPDKDGNQERICKLFNHYLSKEDVYTKVDCNSFERVPYICASCGADITSSCRKTSIPLKESGKNKGQPIECCKNPDFRKCPNKGCEADGAIICKNCGYYYGMVTW